jgi:hypothetical protein
MATKTGLVESETVSRPDAEFHLIRAMLQDDAAAVLKAADHISDWSRLIQIVLHHEILPLFSNNLRHLAQSSIPAPVLLRLKVLLQTNALINVYLSNYLINLLHVFAVQHIRILPFKGPSLAVDAYGRLALRQFADLDLLVADEDFHRATKLLLTQDLTVLHELEWESHFENGDAGVAVDLHRSITPAFFPFPLKFDELWDRRRSTQICGERVMNLGVEDLLLILCATLARDVHDNRIKLKQICDIAALVRVHTTMDWNWLLNEAYSKGAEGILCLGLTMAQKLLDVALPRRVVECIRAHPKVDELAQQVEEHLLGTRSLPLRKDKIKFHSRLRERFRDRLTYHTDLLCKPSEFLVKLLVPNERDWDFVRLPRCLALLYYLIRPVRLLRDRIQPIGFFASVPVWPWL